jgi:Ni,Fe-hydrogenase I small subunit
MPLLTLAGRSPQPAGGVSRRDFIRICTLAAAAMGLPGASAMRFAEAAAAGRKPSVIWLSSRSARGARNLCSAPATRRSTS